MKQIFVVCILINLFFISANGNDCINYRHYKNSYEDYNYLINNFPKKFSAEEVLNNQKNELIRYAQNINNYIINQDIESLLDNMSEKEFNYYDYGEYINIIDIKKSIRKEFKEKKGMNYYTIFDADKLYSKEISIAHPWARGVDIKKYLICYKDKLKWKVFYQSKNNTYHVWFSIPDWLLDEVAYFHYVIRKEMDKYILVGY